MVKVSTLPIADSHGGRLSNRFFKQDGQPTARLAITFPGMGYNQDLPLMYYTHQVLLAHGVDVLQLRPEYQGRAFQALTPEKRLTWLAADAATALNAGLDQGDYQQVILAGKSLGTLSMALLLPLIELPLPTLTIWLTPLLRESVLIESAVECQAPALYVAGTGDSAYMPAAMEFIRKRTHSWVHLAEGANHSLEIPGNPLQSLEILAQCMVAISSYLDNTLTDPTVRP